MKRKKLATSFLISTILISGLGLTATASEIDSTKHGMKTAGILTYNQDKVKHKVTSVQFKKDIKFKDENLEQAVKKELNLSKEESVTTENILLLDKLIVVKGDNNDISSLEGLENAKNLSIITFTNHSFTDITPLKTLPLVSVQLDANRIEDYSPLNNLPLTGLSLSNTNVQVSDYEQFNFYDTLETLFSNNTFLEDISFLNKSKELIDLRIENNQLEDISVLQNMPKIKVLDLANNQIKDITSLNNKLNLTNLILSTNKISDISVLKNSSKLNTLQARNNNINDLSVLKNLIDLEMLDVRHNEVTDILPLNSLQKLYYIDLADNKIKNTKNLEKNTAIQTLLLTRTGLTDSNAPVLPNLIILDASENNLTNINFLKDSKKIQQLGINENAISDVSILNDKTDLKTFIAINQKIKLADVKLGQSTELSIKGVLGVTPDIEWLDNGSYTDGKLLWDNKGNNSLNWTAHNGTFTGTIEQNVINKF